MRSWSVSAVRQFHACQLAWWFKRTGVQEEFRPLPLVEGIVLHEALAHHLRGLQQGELPADEEVLDLIEASFFAQEVSGDVRFSRTDRDGSLGRLGGLYRLWRGNFDPHGEVVAVEAEVRVQFPGVELPLLGFVDLVVRRPDGDAVIDFKVTASKPQADPLLDLVDLQKVAMTRGWEAQNATAVTSWTWSHLVKTKTPQLHDVYLPVAAEDRKGELQRLAAVVNPTVRHMQAILDGDAEPAPTQAFGRTCQSCTYRRTCATWRGPP